MINVDRYNLLFQFDARTQKAEKNISSFQKKLQKFAKAGFITGFSAVGSYALVSFTKELGKAAGRAETINRAFERTFGDLSTNVRKDIVSISEEVKRAGTDIKKGLVSFQSFFVGLGFGSEEASKFSVNVQKAAIDLASFYGIEDVASQRRFISALAGSPEVLDQFGINLKQAALQVELYNMGIKTTVQNTDELIKTQARLNIINRAMTANGILGDAARNIDSYENQVRALNSSWMQFKETVGRFVIPAMNGIVSATNQVLQKLGMMTEETEEMFQAKGDAAKAAAKIVADFANIKVGSPKENKEFKDFLEELKKSPITASQYFKEINTDQRKMAFAAHQAIKIVNEQFGVTITKYDLFRALSQIILKVEQDRAKALQDQSDAMADMLSYGDELYKQSVAEFDIREKISSMSFKEISKDIDNLNRKILYITDNMMMFGGVAGPEATEGLKALRTQLKYLLDETRGKEFETITDGFFSKEIERYFDEDGTLIEIIKSFTFDVNAAFSDMGNGFADGVGSAFGDGIAAFLSGEKSFKQAFKQSMDNMATLMAADLAQKAIFHGILAAGHAAYGNIPRASAHGKAAATFGAGAVIMGGISAAIPNKRTGLGGNNLPIGSYNNLQGQSSFGQVLVAEVDYDKLRFVLNNGNSSSFRSNG